MDREELDRQLKEQGKNIELQTDKFSSGRKKLAAAAVVLLITSFIGGCFFGDIIPGNKQGNKAESSYSFPQTEQKKVEELPAIRNTAVVQAVKEVGPAVVGITTRVYDKDIFNRRVAGGAGGGGGRVSVPVLFLIRRDILLRIIMSCQAAKKLMFLFPMDRLSPAK